MPNLGINDEITTHGDFTTYLGLQMLYSDFKTMITMVSTKIGLKKEELEIDE